jgi:hypothetical protein
VKTVTTTEAKAKLNALLAEVERTGASVTITNPPNTAAATRQHPAGQRCGPKPTQQGRCWQEWRGGMPVELCPSPPSDVARVQWRSVNSVGPPPARVGQDHARHAQGHRCGLQPRPVKCSGFSLVSGATDISDLCAQSAQCPQAPAAIIGSVARSVDRHVTGVRIIGDRHRPLEPREQLHGVEPLASRQAVGVEARDVEHVAWGAAWPWDVKMLNDAIVCITFAYQEMCGGSHL